MVFKVERNGLITITKQLYQYFSDRILSGFLGDGEALPSIRELSKELEVSPMTIIKAYGELEKNGLATTIPGKGTYVNQRNIIENNPFPPELTKRNDSDDLSWQMAVPDYLTRSQFRYNPNLNYTRDFSNLSIASLNHKLLPTEEILKDASSLLQSNPDFLATYPPIQGDSKLRQVMTNYLQTKNVKTAPENLLITNGSQQGISLVATTFVGPGDIVVMETPTYPGAIDIFKCRGAVILTVPVDKDGMRTDILMRLCDKYTPKLIYTMPNFHNPTGFSLSYKRKQELLEIARQTNSLILEDDPWSEITYKKENAQSIKSMDTDGHVIYLKSISKIFGPAYRIAAIVAEGSVFLRLVAAKANQDLGTAMVCQKMITPFFESNKADSYFYKLNKQLLKRRNKVLDLLKKHAPKGVTWNVPEGGINLWLTLPKTMNSETLLFHSITTKSLSFLPGTICFPNEIEYNHLRICFSYLDDENLENTVLDLCKVISAEYTTDKPSDYIPIM